MGSGDKAKFKVGDRVLVTANEDGEGEGKTAVVVWVCSPDWVHVRFEQPIDGWGEDGQEWGVGTEKLELLPVAEATGTLTIQPGKFYKTRGGRKVGPIELSSGGALAGERDRSTRRWYTQSNEFFPVAGRTNSKIETNDDLVAEWVDEPTDTTGYTVPLCAYEESEAVGVNLHIGDGSS